MQKAVYTTYEERPQYKDGESAFYRDLLAYIHIPQDVELGSLRVILALIIDEHGKALSADIRNKEEKEYTFLERAVVKAFERIREKEWVAAKCNGKEVAARIFIPLNLNLQNRSVQNRNNKERPMDSCKTQARSSFYNEEHNNCEFYYCNELKKKVYTIPDVFPEYEGGMVTLLHDFSRSISFDSLLVSPEDALQHTRVIVSVVVDEEGIARLFKINKKDNRENYTEVEKRIISFLEKVKDKWIAAKCNGKEVAARIFIPFHIDFQ